MRKKLLSSTLGLLLGAVLLAGCGYTPTVEPVEKVTAVQEAAPEEVQETAAAETQDAAPAEVQDAAPVEAQDAAPVEAQDAAPVEAQDAAPAAAQDAAPVEAQDAAPAAAQDAVPVEAQDVAPAETQEAAPEEAVQSAEPAAEAETAEPVLAENQMYSHLTGEVIDKEIGEKRPFAVMINNLDAAVPQSGIVYADILYEMFVESDITRLMAVFQDPSQLEKIGPVRSARHNYLSLADDNEAVYTHFGWSIFAEALIGEQGRTTINGMFYDGAMGFFRTSDRVAPHNAYVTGQGLLDIADSLGIDRSYPDGYQQNLSFNLTDTQPAGEDASVINLGYPVNNPWFEYNPEDQLYYRYEYGAPHVDMETGEQLKFKNVLVQYTDHGFVGDTYLLEIYLIKEGEGTGLYFTDGKAVPIKWKKESWEDRTHYFTQDGQPLNLNPGKTMIQIIPESYGVSYSANGAGAAEEPQAAAEEDWGGEAVG